MGTVRCADCGLLTLRNPGTGDYVEPDIHYRREGVRNGQHLQLTDGDPICLAMVFDLRNEVMAILDRPEPQRSLTVITKDRECRCIQQWVQGCSPKEHLAMMHATQLETIAEERKKADAQRGEDRRREDQRRQDERDAQQRDWQAGQSRTQMKYARATAVMAALIGAGAGLAGAYLKMGNSTPITQTNTPNHQLADPPAAKAAP